MDPLFSLIGHRGAPVYAPENTLKSFQKAYECGAKAIEFDVRLTKDGVPIISHDKNLSRVAGVDYYVAKVDFDELRKISINGEKIPTPEEVLEFAKGRMAVDIEIKVVDAEKKVVDLLRKYDFIENSIVTSFIPSVLAAVKKLEPKLKVGVLLSEWDDEYLDIANEVKAYAIVPYYKIISKELYEKIKGSGFKLIVWTVNDADDVLKMLSIGVDGIITDDPCKVIKLIK